MTEQGPEPTGWELMRRLDDLQRAIDKVGDRVVPLGVYESDQRGNAERHARSEARLKLLEETGVEGEKLRRQTRLTVALAIVSPILSAGLAYLMGVIRP